MKMSLNVTRCGIVVSKYHSHVTHDILTTAQKYYTEDPPHSHPAGREPSLASPHIRESKTVLDVRFHALDSGFRIPDSRHRIPVFVSETLDSLSCISCCKSQVSDSTSKIFPDSGFYKQTFSRFRNPDSLSWSDL